MKLSKCARERGYLSNILYWAYPTRSKQLLYNLNT
jgi:hypothetical protein